MPKEKIAKEKKVLKKTVVKAKEKKVKAKDQLKIQIGFCISESLNNKIIKQAKKLKVKKSAFMREILSEKLAKSA